jgi:hypothetical protein
MKFMKGIICKSAILIAALLTSCSAGNEYDKAEGQYSFVHESDNIKEVLLGNRSLSDSDIDSIRVNTTIELTLDTAGFRINLKGNSIILETRGSNIMLDTAYIFLNSSVIEYSTKNGNKVNAILTDSTIKVVTSEPRNRDLLFRKVN